MIHPWLPCYIWFEPAVPLHVITVLLFVTMFVILQVLAWLHLAFTPTALPFFLPSTCNTSALPGSPLHPCPLHTWESRTSKFNNYAHIFVSIIISVGFRHTIPNSSHVYLTHILLIFHVFTITTPLSFPILPYHSFTFPHIPKTSKTFQNIQKNKKNKKTLKKKSKKFKRGKSS